jgi:hypothetical protein
MIIILHQKQMEKKHTACSVSVSATELATCKKRHTYYMFGVSGETTETIPNTFFKYV